MRTTADRIRHTIFFELTGMAISVPLFSTLMNTPMDKTGVLAVGMSIMAMVWNYLYNLGFDHMLLRLDRPVHVRPPWMRCCHAVGFELSFMAVTIPAVAWWLELSLTRAIIMDAGLAGFYMTHAYIYNWVYDRVFPMPGAVAAESVPGE